MTNVDPGFAVRLLLSGAVSTVASVGSAAVLGQDPTFSLKAVRLDPICIGGFNAGRRCSVDDDCELGRCRGAIEPTNWLWVQPGDIIECAIFASNWSPEGQRLAAWQVRLDPAGLTSGGGAD